MNDYKWKWQRKWCLFPVCNIEMPGVVECTFHQWWVLGSDQQAAKEKGNIVYPISRYEMAKSGWRMTVIILFLQFLRGKGFPTERWTFHIRPNGFGMVANYMYDCERYKIKSNLFYQTIEWISIEEWRWCRWDVRHWGMLHFSCNVTGSLLLYPIVRAASKAYIQPKESPLKVITVDQY